jgi:hypothetical protein
MAVVCYPRAPRTRQTGARKGDRQQRDRVPRVTTAVRELELPDKSAAEEAARAVEHLSEFLRANEMPIAWVQLCAEDTGEATRVVILRLPLGTSRLPPAARSALGSIGT